jgi:hypothetical protein
LAVITTAATGRRGHPRCDVTRAGDKAANAEIYNFLPYWSGDAE